MTIPLYRCVYLFVLYAQMNDNPFEYRCVYLFVLYAQINNK